MKSVLISIKPYWVFLIIAQKMGWNIPHSKTAEMRKTYPKEKSWNKKAIIYCTQDKKSSNRIPKEYQELMRPLIGKVIGEFVCDDISKFTAEFTDGKTYEDIRYHYFDEYEDEQEMIVVSNEWENPNNSWICKESCLSFDDFKKYIGVNFHDIPFYTWHISDLKIYDEPKELKRFGKFECEYCGSKKECFAPETIYDCSLQRIDTRLNNNMYRCDGDFLSLKRPPQSWCYVEELRDV